MVKNFKVFRVIGLLAFVLLIILPKITVAQDEIPITTRSEEARKLFLEGRKLHFNNRSDEARDYYDSAIEKDPDFATAYLYRAFICTSAMDYQNHLQKAVALIPKVSDGERLMIEAYQAAIMDNNFVKATQLLEDLAQKYPNDKLVYLPLGDIYFSRNEYDKAIAQFEKATVIDNNLTLAYYYLGLIYSQKGEYEKAEAAIKNYIRLLPNEPNSYDALGNLYSKMSKYQDAIAQYRKALEFNPAYAISQRQIGTNLVYMSRYEEAREAYRKAMGMEVTASGKVNEMSMTSYSYLFESKPQQALVEADKTLKMATDANLPEQVANMYIAKCIIYVEMGDLINAKRSLEECKKVVMSAELPLIVKEFFVKGCLLNEGHIIAKLKDFEKAIAKADEYKAKIEAENDPKQMEGYHELLGYIYLNKGDYAKAVTELNQANHESPYVLYHLAVAESKASDKTKASELFRKVANWNSYDPDVFYALIRPKALKELK